jgi:hypothetical protein
VLSSGCFAFDIHNNLAVMPQIVLEMCDGMPCQSDAKDAKHTLTHSGIYAADLWSGRPTPMSRHRDQ